MEDLTAAYSYLKGSCKEDGQTLLGSGRCLTRDKATDCILASSG